MVQMIFVISIYYIGECLSEKKLKVDPENKHQVTEIWN